MIGNGPLHGFRVPGRRIADIRFAADNVRKILGIGDDPQEIDFGLLLDRLTVKYGLTYDVLEPDEMPHEDVEACWNPANAVMYIRKDVFESACRGEPRHRFTIMHELGHCLLGHTRTINRTAINRPTETYEDSEWQANQFAAEILMPLNVIHQNKLNTASSIATHFNVSAKAAATRVKQLQKRSELEC